ncbi:hypothetical protein N7466_002606 [Penicillium verhagenii]|uniref:uncharacterized protein n=1 Tax=Penicillium verhagenii TaxID=1562060 RepID=UPI0025454EBE|nr:uncharacterized protein N7466_002606 [Penicillium verhagenii]KAJ5939472.1 hypothetical protein N7466_002606 [Penicillium verhagenii]
MSKGALAQQIEILEAQLAAALAENASTGRDGSDQSDATSRPSRPRKSHQDSHLHGVIRFLTLGNDPNGEQAYLGPSSGVSMVENVSRLVHDAAGAKLLPIEPGSQQPEGPMESNDEPKAAPPDDRTGSKVLDAYFNNMHRRLPFLDRCEILKLHARRKQVAGNMPEEQFGQFKLFMVYAIGAVILQVTESYESTPPNAFLATALRFDPTLRESISIASIEAMLLLVLYNLRTTSNSSVWYMIGLAMRTCVDFGLHREARYRKLRPHEAQLQRRLFWSVYVTERYTAWSLGRPFSIPEEEIDAQPPVNMDDSINNDELIDRIVNNHTSTHGQQGQTSLGKFIASIRLQRIVSQIHTRVYRVDKHISALLPEISPLMSALQEFKATLSSLDLADGDFVHMHWNNAIRMLLQPFLSTLNPQDELIGTCLHASGQMCQFFKILRQGDSSGHSYLLVNSVFMAGLTMCFCLFRCPSLWTPAVSNDIRACSSTLCVMAERNPRLKKYRDGLEIIINRAMEYVEDAYQANRDEDGICSSMATGNEQPMHLPTPDPISSSNHQNNTQSLQYIAPQSLGAEIYDWQNTDLFSDLPGLPPNLQSLFTGEHADVLDSSFHGAFAEGFWATDPFHIPFSEEEAQ